MNVSTNTLENAMPDTTSGIRLRYGMHAFENTLLAILLAAMVLIPTKARAALDRPSFTTQLPLPDARSAL